MQYAGMPTERNFLKSEFASIYMAPVGMHAE
jgi:hypothetical protein